MTREDIDIDRFPPTRKGLMAALALAAALMVTPFAGATNHAMAAAKSKGTINLGSKNFTEEYLLADMEQLVMQKAGYKVTQHDLATTKNLQAALLHGDIDMYPEYTGTGFTVVLGQTYKSQTPKQVYNTVKSSYQKKFKLTWLKASPMNDSNAVAVQPSIAKKYKIKTMSQLGKASSKLSFIGLAECAGREDCMLGMQKKYNVKFKSFTKVSSQALIYSALQAKTDDVGEVFSTDAKIAQLKLVVPTDNKHLWPPYQPAPVVRNSVLKKHKDLTKVLNKLAPVITSSAIRGLNAQVDLQHKDAMSVAKAFLKKHHLI